MLFIVREPDVSVTFGSVVAAPYAKDILEKCLKYDGVQPTKQTNELVEVPGIIGMSEEEAENALKEVGLKLHMNGSGAIVAQSPVQGSKVARDTAVDAYSAQNIAEEDWVEVPNVCGMSLYQAFMKLEEVGLELQVEGDTESEKVATQKPAAGSKVVYGDTVIVKCN